MNKIFLLVSSLCLLLLSCNDKKKIVNTFYPSGNVKDEYTILNGKKEGFGAHFYDNNVIEHFYQLSRDSNYGMSISFYENRNVSKIENIKNHKVDGQNIGFYNNGMIAYICTMKNGNLVGDCYSYNENGSRKRYTLFSKNSERVCTIDYDSIGNVIGIGSGSDFIKRDTIMNNIIYLRVIKPLYSSVEVKIFELDSSDKLINRLIYNNEFLIKKEIKESYNYEIEVSLTDLIMKKSIDQYFYYP